jgi:hypothetical protein
MNSIFAGVTSTTLVLLLSARIMIRLFPIVRRRGVV